jgi:hypothetical protein
MSSCLVVFRDHSYFFGCWRFLCKTWRFMPCSKNTICQFLPNVLRGYISIRIELHYCTKTKAVTFTSTSIGVLCFCVSFWKFVFKNLNLGLGYLYIMLSKTQMFQTNLSVFCLNLKNVILWLLQPSIIFLFKASLTCELIAVDFCNKANNFEIPVVTAYSYNSFNFLQCCCILFLTTDIAFLQQ